MLGHRFTIMGGVGQIHWYSFRHHTSHAICFGWRGIDLAWEDVKSLMNFSIMQNYNYILHILRLLGILSSALNKVRETPKNIIAWIKTQLTKGGKVILERVSRGQNISITRALLRRAIKMVNKLCDRVYPSWRCMKTRCLCLYRLNERHFRNCVKL